MDLEQYGKDLEAALNQAVSNHLQLTQGKLVKYNPVDSGRMRSSWFIGHNQEPEGSRPKDWAKPGAAKNNAPPYTGKITADGIWYIVNNVPYAQKVAFDPRYAGGPGSRSGANWYWSIFTLQPYDLDEQISKQMRKIG